MDMTSSLLVSIKHDGQGVGGWMGVEVYVALLFSNLNKIYASHMDRRLFPIGLFGFCSLISDIHIYTG